MPVSTIAAPLHQKKNSSASSIYSRHTTTPRTLSSYRRKQNQTLGATTENIRLSTFQMVEVAAKSTTPKITSSKPDKNTTQVTKSPIRTTMVGSTTTKSSTKAPLNTQSKRTTITTTTNVYTKLGTNITTQMSKRHNTTIANQPTTAIWTIKGTPPPGTKGSTSTLPPLAQRTTEIKATSPTKTSQKTTQNTTVYKNPQPSIITGSTLKPITMPYRNLTNRNPTTSTTFQPLNKYQSNKTAAFTETKPIYINITQATKAPRPKPKPTSEIAIVPPTSLSDLADTTFTTIQYVSSSSQITSTTTTRPIVTSTPQSIIVNSTSYVTNTSFRPSPRPTTTFSKKTTTPVSSSIKTTKKTTTRPAQTTRKSTTKKPEQSTVKTSTINRISPITSTKPVSITTSRRTTQSTTSQMTQTTPRSTRTTTTYRTQSTTKPSQPTIVIPISSSIRTSTRAPISSSSISSSSDRPVSTKSTANPNTEKDSLVTWTSPPMEAQNDTKQGK